MAQKNNDEQFKNVISHAKEYGFVFQSSEIYDGLSAVYDYGQLGAELKNNIKTYWWKAMVQMHENIVGIDSAIFMHPKVWKASGHVDGFNDPMIDNKDSKKRYRADQLLENKIDELYSELANFSADNKAKFEAFQQEILGLSDEGQASWVPTFKDEETILDHTKYPFVEEASWRFVKKGLTLEVEMNLALKSENLAQLKDLIVDYKVICPISKTSNWTDVRQFNLMFSTQFGAMAEGSDEVYLRPETAQGIFVNFLNVQKSGRMKIPFGIAQIGKAFRNEVIARQFIMRMREFEQMEMQFFVRPGEDTKWFEYWKEARLKWHKALGTNPEKYRYHDHVKLAHYANAATDIEFEFPFGFKEVEGIHSRTDFDLTQHQEYSGKKMQYFDNDLNEEGKPYGNYVPYVIETSIGLDRMFLLTMINAFEEQDLSTDDKQDSRTLLRLHPALAPYKVAIFPLTKKDGLPEKAREIMDTLKFDFNCIYEEKDAIGKRYRRQDAVGTPFCITVDHQSLEDNTVTIRHRDSMEQERVAIADLGNIIGSAVSWKTLLA
ncbi:MULTISPECIES: glycine--tRNA ligase [unclassified Pedobacter]|uniref:glycine--tRNA ligase n=1 Tax=unclassified Pedobacter TaxID=2628915 RepID=UPI0014225B07|nr:MULTISPECIES: glycine--tRNA ligase [unclassified Pedobacter]NII81610.1 glycyl-tRNA synthetase [Pedobacter sp. SG908]NMN35614.1 glycyl-tRNA synthetase [Pedobacter sp. SG918]